MSVTWNTDADMTPAQAQAEKAAQEAVRWAVRDALLASPDGMTNTEMYARFGASAVKRLNDLKRHHGYDYRRQFVGPRTWRYVLIEPGAVTSPSAPTPSVTSRMVSEAARILARAGRARRASSRPLTREPHQGSFL